jgi:SNF2 family DNA or RNA helicase
MAFGWSWLDQSQSLDMPPEDFSTFLQRYFTSPLADKLRLNLEKKPLRQGKINIEVASGIDWLGLQLIVDDTRFTTDEIMEAKHGLIQTKKQFLAVDQEYLEHLRALQARSISSSVTEIRISNHDALAYPELKKLVNPNEQGALIPLQKLHQAWQDQDLLGQQPASILLQAQLRPYQKEGLNWLRLLKKLQLGGILADDMGLGKTLQSLALMADYLDEGQTGPFLILAPVSTLRNWQREIQRFLPALPCLLHIGPQRPEHLPHQAAILTSYQTYLQDQHIFQPMPFTLLIIDEAQNLKNPATKAFKAVQSLQSGQRLLLTGTPMENSLIDLWALMQTALPHYLGEKKHFKRTHITAKNQDKEKALAILHQKLKPFLLRRTKESVAQDLPSKEEIPLWVEMDQAQKRSYLNLEAQLRHKVQNLLLGPKPWLAGLEILQALTQLRQLAIAPELIGKKLPSAKFQLAVEKIDEALSEDHSVLVFSQFTGALKILRRMLDDRRLSYAYLDGSMSSRQREKEIQAFSESAGPSLFLLSLKAGGVGLNLTKADYVFLLDPWWEPCG